MEDMMRGEMGSVMQNIKLDHEKEIDKLRTEIKRIFEEKNSVEIEAANLKTILSR